MSGLEPGGTLGDYTILARIRAGAMGALYLARPRASAKVARPVALKVIHEHLAQNKRFVRMFIAEAKLSGLIEDPHVVHVEHLGEDRGRHFLVMEFVHGVSLAQALGILRRRGGIPVDVCVAIAMDVANGLHAAHEARDERGQPLKIVHRDVSPHNVLVSYDGKVKVIDFGIAKARESAAQTMTGSIRGKLAYMPPEQARDSKHVDRRADLYALGLVLWEMLVGRRLFAGKSDIALLNQIRNPVIIAPSEANPRVPKALDAVVLKLLEQEPQNRPATAADVARLLARACPTATKVLAADIAAVMKTVREVATATAPPAVAVLDHETITAPGARGDDADDGHDEEDDALYGEEVKKELTLFDQGMRTEVGTEDAHTAPTVGSSRDVVAQAKAITQAAQTQKQPPAIEPDEEAGNKTKVMMKPPTSSARAVASVPPEIKQTFRLDRAVPPAPASSNSGIATVAPPEGYEEITKNHKIQPRPSAAVPLNVLPAEGPPPPKPPEPEPPPPSKSVFFSGPVLGVLGVVFVALLAAYGMQSFRSSASRDPKSVPTAPTVTNRPRTPVENAREAAAEGNSAAVRSYLEKGVRGGKATTEEVQLVQGACLQMGDLKCVDQISKIYPSVPRPQSMLPP